MRSSRQSSGARSIPARRLERSPGIPKPQPADPDALRLLAAADLRDPCDLDLLLFFSRHPRVVLRHEQIATYVGYEVRRVVRSIDRLLGAGLLKRTLDPADPGAISILEVDHGEHWVALLRRVGTTPEGRHRLKMVLRQRSTIVTSTRDIEHA